MRCSPEILTITEICCIVKLFPLTPVKTIHQDGLYQAFFKHFISCHFSTPTHLRRSKVKFFRHHLCCVHSWQSNACHGGEECPAHPYGHFVYKGGIKYSPNIGLYKLHQCTLPHTSRMLHTSQYHQLTL